MPNLLYKCGNKCVIECQIYYANECGTECAIVHQSKKRFECVIKCQIYYVNKFGTQCEMYIKVKWDLNVWLNA